MSYSINTAAAAEKEIFRRKSAAELQRDEKHLEAVAKIPEIRSIERKLAETGIEAARAIISGGDAVERMKQLAEENLLLQRRIKTLLVENGFGEDYLDIKYVCTKCNDSGYVEGYPCDCLKTLLRKYAFEELCACSPAAECTFNNFSTEYYPEEIDPDSGLSPRKRLSDYLDYCKSYAEDFSASSPNLLFYGATGLGKTHLSLAVAGEVAKGGSSVIYDSASSLLRKLEKEHFNSSKTNDFDGTYDRIIDCDLLIIDDLGSEFSTSFTVSTIYDIINDRLNCGRATIISTNFSIAEIEKRYSQRVASRIIGNYVPFLFIGKDIRQIK